MAKAVYKTYSEEYSFLVCIYKFHSLFANVTCIFKYKKETFYCYNDEEKQAAINNLGGKPEITRFKGLGEISPHEFEAFIGKEIKLDPVIFEKESSIPKILGYYMGKNTPERQVFIIDNLKIELDQIKQEEEVMDLENVETEELT